MEWLIQNYMYVIEIVLVVLSVIIFLIRIFKTGKADYLSALLVLIPDYIKEAENKYSSGSDKLYYVMTKVYSYLNSLNLKNYEKEKLAVQCVSYIENVLSTPQKKEDKLDESKKSFPTKK